MAFLASRPKKFISYDLQYNNKMDYLKLIAKDNDIDFEIRIENPTPEEDGGESKLPFDPDFLFIDTNHFSQQMTLELKLHAPRVKKYIGMHDVFVYWNRGAGDDHLADGLKYAVEPFLASHPEWQVIYRTDENNGLMIMERIV